MKYCTSCGAEIGDEARYCSICGTKQRAQQALGEPSRSATGETMESGRTDSATTQISLPLRPSPAVLIPPVEAPVQPQPATRRGRGKLPVLKILAIAAVVLGLGEATWFVRLWRAGYIFGPPERRGHSDIELLGHRSGAPVESATAARGPESLAAASGGGKNIASPRVAGGTGERSRVPAATEGARVVALGGLVFDIPAEWRLLPAEESRALAAMFGEQLQKLDRDYDGELAEPAQMEMIVFQTSSGGRFEAVRMQLAVTANLMATLRAEVPEKVRWGIDQGLIKRASAMTSVARDGFEGFQMEMESPSGEQRWIGGLTHSRLGGEVIQFQITAAPQENLAETFGRVLDSARLADGG
jgi:hypothetical protein